MNIWLKRLLHVAALALIIFTFAFAATGNWVFDSLYLRWSNLQIILIIVTLFWLPYYVRHIVRLK